MKIIKQKLTTAKQHLEWDDQFHNNFDINPTHPHLRIWELTNYAIILGKANKQALEVSTTNLKDNSLSVLRRSSGGGSVLLGPGCLCYSLFIPINHKKEFQSITQTNNIIMNTMKEALSTAIKNITVQGYTDLCLSNKKFSGNAQKRKKNSLLFHGTLLYNFDINIISKYLLHPPKEPNYRMKRNHNTFLTNLPLTKSELEAILLTKLKL